MITTEPSFAQTYGYFEMRAELPTTAGAWPAFWLIPADGSWPPELDVMETLDRAIPARDWTTAHSGVGGAHTVHRASALHPRHRRRLPHLRRALDRHRRSPGTSTASQVFQTATPADMNKPMYMIANLALGGWGGRVDDSQLPGRDEDRLHPRLRPGRRTLDDRRFRDRQALRPPRSCGGRDRQQCRHGAATGDAATTGAATPPTPATLAAQRRRRLRRRHRPPRRPGPAFTHLGDPRRHLVGGAGADTLSASQGADKLTGGAAPTLPVQEPALERRPYHRLPGGVDKIDISSLYLGGYKGSDPVADGYVTFISDGAGGTKIMLDIEGKGPPIPGLTPSSPRRDLAHRPDAAKVSAGDRVGDGSQRHRPRGDAALRPPRRPHGGRS